MKFLHKIWSGKSTAKKNVVADTIAVPLPVDQINQRLPVPFLSIDLSQKEFLDWQQQYFPEGAGMFKTPMHKKLLELFVSFRLLNILPEDVYMDAAGGQYSYASRVACRKKIIQDIRLSEKLKAFHGNQVTYLDSSCAAIPLPDQSVNKISCHHSIEHFQKDADIGFMKEIQRLLAPGGKCVILPIFIAASPLLLSDRESFLRWEEEGRWIIDTTATLPGGAGSGHFSRIYSPETLANRLLNEFNKELFNVHLVSVYMNGEEIPNEKQFMTPEQAVMNYYYKVLVIERK